MAGDVTAQHDRAMLYILKNDRVTPELVPDEKDWARWHGESARMRWLAHDILLVNEATEVRISTVFLGLDRGQSHGPPILWETMIFGGKYDQYQRRYTSYADAADGHVKAVEMVIFNGETEDDA